MIASIYTRLSRDDGGRDINIKSVTIQADDCRAFAAKQGWTVDEQHVYSDDGVSGAIFGEGRPGFDALLSVLTPPKGRRERLTWRPPFDVLLVSEQSRLGRDQIHTPVHIAQIEQAGVKIFEVRSGNQVTTEGMGSIVTAVQAVLSEQERKKNAQRLVPAKRRRAEQGLVAGGITFGYDNVRALAVSPLAPACRPSRLAAQARRTMQRKLLRRWGTSSSQSSKD
jgi:DNA invertase Pin-like site-specific DNA recombinase